jgi:hypothetical protein
VQKESEDISFRILQTRGNLENLRDRYRYDSRVLNPYPGRVAEVFYYRGQLVQGGQPLYTIELDAKRLTQALRARLLREADARDLVLFMDAYQGKKVVPGMRVLVVPPVVKEEEYGAIKGKSSGSPASPSPGAPWIGSCRTRI